MQFSACLNPQYVRNEYTGQMVQVPCGHCAACLVSRPRTKVQRLQAAREMYYDSIFFTLTFSNDFVPRGELVGYYVYHSLDLVKEDTNFADLRDYFFPLDVKYIEAYDKQLGFIPLLSKRIPSTFIELLRERIGVGFDWFITGEYGPTTYRPHYHGLLFFNRRGLPDNERIAVDAVSDAVTSCWTTDILSRLQPFKFFQSRMSLGEVRIRYDLNSSAQYTAAYLNSVTHLPKLLQVAFPPFSRYSRTLPLLDRLSPSSIRELLFTGDCKVNRTKIKRGLYNDESVYPSFNTIRRYFPQFRGSNYLYDPCVIQVVLYVSSVSLEKFKDELALYFGQFGVFHTIYTIFGDFPRQSQIESFYYAIRSMRNIARRFHVPIRHYLSVYSSVYSKLELIKLRQFYELQEQIADDPFLDVRYINGLYIVNSEQDKPFPDADIKFSLLYDNPLFIKYQNLMTKILLDTSKTKKRNDYIGFI